MHRASVRLLVAVVVVVFGSVLGIAQTSPKGTLTGLVTDPSSAVLSGAAIEVTENATSTKYETRSDAEGHFVIANLAPGTYTVTVTSPSFKTGIYSNVQIVVGRTYDLKAVLQIGEVSATVKVEAGAQVIEATQSSVSTTITGDVITHVPSPSNSALWGLSLLSPDVQTIGGPRQSSADGLPGGSVNVTYDGISAQWNNGKSGDPLFTMVYPNIDNVAEFNISTAAGNAAQTGEGAVQINMVSARGTNSFHGGVWEYFRNDALNSNYYFNNLAGLPRQKMRYNQWGGKIGGPIIKNKLFFFADYGEWDRPQGVARTQTILTPQAAQGLFTYAVRQAPASTPSWVTCNAGALTCTANLMQMAGSFGGRTQVDSIIGGAFSAMQQASSAPGVRSLGAPSFNQQSISFNNQGTYKLNMPDFRLDWNAAQNHSLEFDYHLTRFILTPDILNGRDPTFPVAPFSNNRAGYLADRSIFAWAWRWNIGNNKSNEVRFGFQTSAEWFATDLNPSVYPVFQTNLGSVHVQPALPAGLVTNPWLAGAPSRDNPSVGQLSDNFAWTKGTHNMAFGVTATRSRFFNRDQTPAYATVNVGLAATDPMSANFNSTNLPGISPADSATAQSLYGTLIGSITGYSGSVALDPSKGQFVTGAPRRDQYHSTDFGTYATDSWRFRPTLTFNYGLRWEYEGVPVDDLNEYFGLQGGYPAAFGVSGLNNLFKPGTLAGSTPTYVLGNGKPWYNNWYKGFAPSLGLAWQPNFDNTLWQKVLGKPGESVFRGGYSIAYSREGLINWSSIVGGNPGFRGSQFTNPVAPAGSIAPGQFAAGSLQLQSQNMPTLAQNPSSFTNSFPIDPTTKSAVGVFDPNLHMPYVQSWSFGVQRSITSNMALELRYVGNHGVGLWQNLNLNEVNIFENGFLTEFNNAVSNLKICQATPSCSASPSFANLGLPGQVSLPIFTGAFTGSTNAAAGAATQSNRNFSSGNFTTPLTSGQAGSIASTLTQLTFWQNLIGAGYPRNFWQVNPDAGASRVLKNGLQSNYNAFVVDLRRRPSHGITFDVNYTFAKALTDDWQRNTNNGFSFTTLRDPSHDKGPSPYDLRHAIKLYSVLEAPFGPGHRWASSNSFVNRLIEGWQFNAINRWQSGRPTLLTGGLGGTFNQNDGGVQLNGISPSQLQSQLGVYATPTPAPGAVWYFPQSLLDANGQKANSSVLQACGVPGQLCRRLFIYGPDFFRADWSIQKNTRITERIKSELRFEFLNAFNNPNFYYAAPSVTFGTPAGNLQSTSFGRITSAYQDLDTTDDPGGRVIQVVARFTF